MYNERFTELLTKQLSTEISDAELTEFQRLLNSDKLYRQQYEFFKDYWKQKDEQYVNSEQLFNNIKSRIEVGRIQSVVVEIPARKKSLTGWLRIAAAVLVLLGCLALYKWQTNANAPVNSFESTATRPKTQSIITLTDGTQVTLNSESTLKYPPTFTGKTREVYLSGEAFFDVHKDHEHPFIIHTQKMNIRVLGTAFNVKAYPKDLTTETTLIRGAIEVTLNDRPSDRIILKPKDKLILENETGNTNKPLTRKPSLAAIINPTQYTLTKLTYFNPEDSSVIETAWLKNKLLFRNEDFATLAERMQRWYGVAIIFDNDEVKQYRFNGIFEKETINQALDALRITEKFHYKIEKSAIHIY